mgnify:CR=1 FL=1
MATHEELQNIHLLLDEFQNNYKGIAVIESVLRQIKQALPERRKLSSSRSPMEEDYEKLIGILPYSLWPSML